MTRKPYFPKAVAIPRSPQPNFLRIEYLSYCGVGGVQISSLTSESIRIESILINGEFFPSLFVPHKEGYDLPRELCGYGDSIIVITDAPTATLQILSRCYGKPVLKVEVGTDRGRFLFGTDESIDEDPISER